MVVVGGGFGLFARKCLIFSSSSMRLGDTYLRRGEGTGGGTGSVGGSTPEI